jgi:hypothetical protein
MNDNSCGNMKYFWIKFKTNKDELRGYEVLLDSSMPTSSTADDRYMINELQEKMLKRKHVAFVYT